MEADKLSRRIVFDKEDLEYLREYKEEYGVDLQFFVVKAVKDKIAELKVQQFLNEK